MSMDLMCKVIFLEWLLTLLLERIKGLASINSWNSAIPDFVCSGKFEIRRFLCNYYEVLLRRQSNILLLFVVTIAPIDNTAKKKKKRPVP